MADDKPFSAQSVGELAAAIEQLIVEVARLKQAAENARNELNSAEVRLSNTRSEFTRAVEHQLDPTWLSRTVTRI
jgi:hypothetical protein